MPAAWRDIEWETRKKCCKLQSEWRMKSCHFYQRNSQKAENAREENFLESKYMRMFQH